MIVKVPRRKPGKIALASLAGISLLSLAACSSSSKSSSAPPSSSPSSPAGSTGGGTLLTPLKVTGTISGPGVTANTITIGDIATVTGPQPGLFEGANQGMDAWAAYINAAGGIDGHQVKVVHLDDANDCNTYKADLNQLATTVFAAVGTFSVQDPCAEAALKAHPNFPYIPGAALAPTMYTLSNVYTPTPAPVGVATTIYNYVKSRFPNAITHAAALELGNPVLIEAAAESVGYKFVYQRVYPTTETSFLSDILRMKAAGVQVVDMTYSDVVFPVRFLQEAAQQNYHPMLIDTAIYDSSALKLLGNPSLASNLYVQVKSALWLNCTDCATVPAVNTLDTWMARAQPNANLTLYAESAWAAADLFLEAMHNAGSQITQTSLLGALSQIKSFDANGLTPTDDPGARTLGTPCIVVAGIVKGQWARVYPPSGFDCNGVWNTGTK
jgi:ABC-type branched-subunit amino acid transport system substrate-binding protein